NVVSRGVATHKVVYSPELFTQEACELLARYRQQPFFLYLAYTLPHANNEAGRTAGLEVPSDDPYRDRDWPQAEKNFAAMVTKLDAEVGLVLARLAELGLADDTLVFFTSDNGPHQEAGRDPAFFRSSGPLRGIKRSMHDGGTRVPFIVRWPGHIAPGTTDQVAAFWDVLPTLAELAGAAVPAGVDGLSLTPTLLGEAAAGRPQPQHEYLYWEFYEGGFQQAIRAGNWKGVRPPGKAPLQLYDLSSDPHEDRDLAAEHADVVARLKQLLVAARTDSPDYPRE
ncbi:MAG: sulfatase-like hydrolase/transferase, partial [Gemmatimonadaceae bacterium]